VRAFLDTEFTDLVIQPRLLSVGIVAGCNDGPEFYAEVTDEDRVHATGRYGRAAVLPQFGKLAHAACTYAELGHRLAGFLQKLVARLSTGEFVELAYGYDLDWELVDLAVEESGARHWGSTRHRLRPVNVYEIAGHGPGRVATEAYFESQACAPISRHHALCDARALRVAHEAATRAPQAPLGTGDRPSGPLLTSTA
jgi:hypothetical protein